MKGISDRRNSVQWSDNKGAGSIRSAVTQWAVGCGRKQKSGERTEMKQAWWARLEPRWALTTRSTVEVIL